jgi:hypothetical protein
MAKVRNNIVMHGLSGTLGDQITVKQDKAGRTIMSVKATYPEDRQFTEQQKAQQEQFKEAAAYAKGAAKVEPMYAQKAEGTPKSAYNVAMADWFHPPEIADIDLAQWTGQAGQTIRIKASDDMKVSRVTVVITDENDAVLEQGAATAGDGVWWNYTTTAAASGQPKVVVSAADLPGHIAKMVKTK